MIIEMRMTVKEFFDCCILESCYGIMIVNELADHLTARNVIDIIDPEPFISSFRHTVQDMQKIYGFDREILGFRVSGWDGCGCKYVKIKLKGVSSDYDVRLGHFIVMVDEKKYISYLYDESCEYDYFKLLENEVD